MSGGGSIHGNTVPTNEKSLFKGYTFYISNVLCNFLSINKKLILCGESTIRGAKFYNSLKNSKNHFPLKKSISGFD
jgi:hypothetical protein